MNKRIFKSEFELKNYFNDLIELNHEKEYEYLSGNGYFKLGGCFSFFNKKMEFLMKFVLTPGKKLSIQIINEVQTNREILEYLLNTFEFLLSEAA